jgi:hypothetical protein
MLKLIIPSTIVIALAGVLIFAYGRSLWVPVYRGVVGDKTIDDVQREAGPRVRAALESAFLSAGLTYPPRELTVLAFKQEKRLELWARDDNAYVFVKEFPLLAASGKSGPKLLEGDRQVPEGIYAIEYLNPNSSYYLSMKLDYPNEFDRTHAEADGRTTLGGDIFIHGNAVSIGCLAIGDEAAEQLFVLTSLVGEENVRVIIGPSDIRNSGVPKLSDPKPAWLPELYDDIYEVLKDFKR